MISAERCDLADVLPILAAIQSEKTDSEGRVDVVKLAARGDVFRVVRDGEVLAAYVLESSGPLLWISAYGGRADVDLVAVLAGLVERQATGFTEIGFRTERVGLVRKARRHGYRLVRQMGRQFFMRKSLK